MRASSHTPSAIAAQVSVYHCLSARDRERIELAQFNTSSTSVTFLSIDLWLHLPHNTYIMTMGSYTVVGTSCYSDLHLVGCEFLCEHRCQFICEILSLNKSFRTICITRAGRNITHADRHKSVSIYICHYVINIFVFDTLDLNALTICKLKFAITVLV